MAELDIDDVGELIFRTYFMLDWSSVHQMDSDQVCLTCGNNMKRTELIRDKKGLTYDGLVCHNCKKVFWLKRG